MLNKKILWSKKCGVGVVFFVFFVLLKSNEVWSLSGVCSDCHTMHNSQGNAPMVYGNATTPNPLLLKGDCLGCHAQGGNKAIVNWGGGRLPQVYHTDSRDLAGGNFAYITGLKGSGASVEKGHNVIALVGQDTINNMVPPGGIKQTGHDDGTILEGELNCAGENGCHGSRIFMSGVKELAAIKGAHHRNVTGWCNGTYIYDSYRFLIGVKGYEDNDWQYTATSSEHNEYFGRTTPVQLGCSGSELSCHGNDGNVRPPDGTISQFCASCHGDFHTLTTARSTGVGATASSPWLRHPTDWALPSDVNKEYRNYNNGTLEYSLLAPVARTVEPINGTSSNVTPGQDAVMCLSCHYAHASDYPDMLRWDYNLCVASGGYDPNCGCFICHTTKY